jgi:hypothetical protein
MFNIRPVKEYQMLESMSARALAIDLKFSDLVINHIYFDSKFILRGRYMKFRNLLAVAALVGLSVNATPASAVSIFFDDFNRANNATVGNGWQEGSGVSITSNQLAFTGNSNPTTFNATQGTLTLSTVGLTNITLEYDWLGIDAEANDTLQAYWSLDGTNFTLLGTNLLSTASLTHATWSLGAAAANQSDVTIQFRYTSNMGNDNARLDNVSLTGDVSAVPGPIFGAGLPGLVMALGGMVFLARRRRNKASAP